MPEEQLAPRAALGAALETGISRLEFLTMGARLPGVQAALAKYGKYGRWGAGALNAAGAIAGGTALEPFENSALESSSEFFSAVKKDLPEPKRDEMLPIWNFRFQIRDFRSKRRMVPSAICHLPSGFPLELGTWNLGFGTSAQRHWHLALSLHLALPPRGGGVAPVTR